MKLEVIRFNKGTDSTNGILFDITNGKRKFLCYTLEDESRTEKVWGETCIPEGEYCIGLRTVGGHHAKYSKRFADIHLGMLHTQAYFRVYPEIAKALEEGEEVTITYRDFSDCLLLEKSDVASFFDKSN